MYIIRERMLVGLNFFRWLRIFFKLRVSKQNNANFRKGDEEKVGIRLKEIHAEQFSTLHSYVDDAGRFYPLCMSRRIRIVKDAAVRYHAATGFTVDGVILVSIGALSVLRFLCGCCCKEDDILD